MPAHADDSSLISHVECFQLLCVSLHNGPGLSVVYTYVSLYNGSGLGTVYTCVSLQNDGPGVKAVINFEF